MKHRAILLLVMTVVFSAGCTGRRASRPSLNSTSDSGAAGSVAPTSNALKNDKYEILDTRTDQFDFALRHYQKYVDEYNEADEVSAACLAGVAASHEALDNYPEAIKLYHRVIDEYPQSFQKAEYMLALARCYGAQKQRAQAREWYDEVIRAYPETSYERTAQKEKQLLGPLG